MTYDRLKQLLKDAGFKRARIEEGWYPNLGIEYLEIYVSKIPSVGHQLTLEYYEFPQGLCIRWNKLPWWKNWFERFVIIERESWTKTIQRRVGLTIV